MVIQTACTDGAFCTYTFVHSSTSKTVAIHDNARNQQCPLALHCLQSIDTTKSQQLVLKDMVFMSSASSVAMSLQDTYATERIIFAMQAWPPSKFQHV